MWRGDEDFTLLCIKIMTVDGTNKPTINIIEPNPELSRFSDFPGGQIPEMSVLHQKDVHYDLIVPRDSRLAKDGGFDIQRDGKKKDESVKDEDKEKKTVVSKEKEKIEKKVRKDVVENSSELLIQNLEEKISKFEIVMKTKGHNT